mgnify:CR=1 FL=1
MTLKQLRTEKGITQAKCAELFQVSLRTYKRYESNETKINPLKYQYLLQRLSEYGRIDEDHGILSIDQIKKYVEKYSIDTFHVSKTGEVKYNLAYIEREKQGLINNIVFYKAKKKR